MGQINIAELSPATVVAKSVRDVAHDLSVYVCNACKSECDFCGCWRFGFQTFETHDSDSSSDSSSANTLCGPLWEWLLT